LRLTKASRASASAASILMFLTAIDEPRLLIFGFREMEA